LQLSLSFHFLFLSFFLGEERRAKNGGMKMTGEDGVKENMVTISGGRKR
jgi:uncharacterized protein YodC (DUF2158 family)